MKGSRVQLVDNNTGWSSIDGWKDQEIQDPSFIENVEDGQIYFDHTTTGYFLVSRHLKLVVDNQE